MLSRITSRLSFPRGILPLLPVAPLIVSVVGVTTAMVIAMLGVSQLQQTANAEARRRAVVLSATLQYGSSLSQRTDAPSFWLASRAGRPPSSCSSIVMG